MPTPRAELPQLSEAQAGKTITINEAFAKLEALTVGAAVTRTTTTPPSSPSEGDIYLIPAAATGAWQNKTNMIAHYLNGTWNFYFPKNGYVIFSLQDEALYFYKQTTDTWTQI